MKHRMFRIVIAVILVCALLVSWSPIRVQAMAGGGVIGGTSAAGLALSPGMVGLLLLAAFGVYYAYNDATTETLGYDLEELLEAEVTNAQLSTQQSAEYAAALTSWWESAKAGAIDLASAPAWITDCVKAWAADFFSGSSVSTTVSLDRTYYGYPCAYSDEPFGMVWFTSETRYFVVWYSRSPTSVYIDTDFDSTSTCMTINLVENLYGGSPCNGLYFFGSFGSISDLNRELYDSWPFLGNFDDSLLRSYDIYSRSNGYGRFVALNYLNSLVFSTVYGSGLTSTQDVLPFAITGGIAEEIEKGTDMDVIGLPNIVIPGPDVLPVSPSEGQTDAQAVTDYLLAALIAGEITWEQYWQLIGVYNPAIGSSVPTVGTADPVTGTITNTEISTGTVVTPSAITDYSLDLTQFFPFCLPFDIYAFFELLAADPEAPHLEFDIEFPYMKEPWHLVIDLSAWDDTALLLRRLELLAFIIGLCVFTREKFLRS